MKSSSGLIAAGAMVAMLAVVACSSSDSPGDSSGQGGLGGAAGTGGVAGNGGAAGASSGGSGGTGRAGSGAAGKAGSGGGGAAGTGGNATGGSGGTGPAGSGGGGGTAGKGGTGGVAGSSGNAGSEGGADSGTGGVAGADAGGSCLDLSNLSGTGLAPPLGDGSSEGPKLQAALDYAKAHGFPCVLFPPGMTIMNSERLIFPAGITVYGNGSTIKRINGTGVRDYQTANVYGKVTHLKFAGTDEGWLEASHDGACGVYMFSGSEIEGCEIYHFCAYSLAVFAAPGQHDIKITNNTVHDSLQYGITTGPGDPPVGNDNISVTGNTVYNCHEVGIKIRGVNSATISNNDVTLAKDADARGIALYSDDGDNYNVVIDHNKITGLGTGTGIESDTGGINRNITITNNTLAGCATSLLLPNISGTKTISGNTCDGSPCP
jgi:hypothetical protein